MEEFSQSRGDDDLFDDEIVPIEPSPEPVEDVTKQVEQVTLEATSPPTATEQLPVQIPSTTSRGRGRGRARGRGGLNRDQHKPGGLSDSKYAPKPATNQDNTAATQSSDNYSQQSKEAQSISSSYQQESNVPSAAPSGPSNPTPARPPAVRGDRTATGGLRKPKLTEEELSAKLAAAKERSQNLAAAHARAQADADNFAERERIATQKRAKEKEERKVMEGERERNRERKLRALGGREWDVGKDELDTSKGGRPRRQGDFNEEENDLSMYEWKEDRGRGRGRGRGRVGRGGRGRGDYRNDGRPAPQTQPDLNAEADFPALPQSKSSAAEKRQVPQRKDSEPVTGSWADQVESSEAAKS